MLDPAQSQYVSNAVSDLAQLGTPVAWTIGLFFLRDVYREFKDLRKDVHGSGGLNERVARIEGREGMKT